MGGEVEASVEGLHGGSTQGAHRRRLRFRVWSVGFIYWAQRVYRLSGLAFKVSVLVLSHSKS